MKKILINVFVLFLWSNVISARGLVLNLRYSENESSFDSIAMKTSLSEIGYDMITYIVDKNRSISEYAEKVYDNTYTDWIEGYS